MTMAVHDGGSRDTIEPTTVTVTAAVLGTVEFAILVARNGLGRSESAARR
jgi:hypothetical protein